MAESSRPKYRLIYFNFRGKGEPLRWMFCYAGVPFDDFRIADMGDSWAAVKPTLPYGVVPVLVVDGRELGEQHAIARYLAKEFGLTGKDAWEEAQADAVVSHLSETDTLFMLYFREKDPAIKAALNEKLDAKIHALSNKVADILQTNSAGQGFLVGQSPTIADFLTAGFFDAMTRVKPGSMDSYTVWRAHRDRIHALPGVREFIAEYAGT